MENLIAALFIVTSTVLLVGTFVEEILRWLVNLLPDNTSDTPEWIEALAELLERQR